MPNAAPVAGARSPRSSWRHSPRGNTSERGYGTQWQKARRAFLSLNPICVTCAERGRTVPATVVDHIVPHGGDAALFWDEANWQPLCERCHNAKSSRERRGRGVKSPEPIAS